MISNQRLLTQSSNSSSAITKASYAETGYTHFSSLSTDELLKAYNTTKSGLIDTQIPSIRKIYGDNLCKDEERCPALHMFINSSINPFNALLAFLSVVIYYSGDDAGCIIVLVMVLLSSITTFIQEYRSSNAVKKLQNMITSNILVMRRKAKEEINESDDIEMMMTDDSKNKRNQINDKNAVKYESFVSKVPIKNIVPGDLIHLNSGNMIPADIRLIESNFLHINQSSMTGESMAVEKDAGWIFDQEHSLFDYPNLVFQGSSVVSGSARGIVLFTGKNTVFGKMKKQLSDPKTKTAFDQGINTYIYMMVAFMIGMGVSSLIINLNFKQTDFYDALQFSLAVAVGLTPEMLPMIITVNLAKGALEMSKKDVIVKKLTAIQNIGAMDILCLDKTGTLTDDKIVMASSFDASAIENCYPLELAYYIAELQTGLTNFLDIAIIEKVSEKYPLIKQKLCEIKKLNEIPFDFTRRCMSVIIASSSNTMLLCKGSPEELIQRCISYLDHDIEPLDLKKKIEILSKINEFNRKGFRVIAVAYRSISNSSEEIMKETEKDLIFVGFLTFYDPPKSTSAECIKRLMDRGLKIKVLTGDNPYVSEYICKEVGIPVDSYIIGQNLSDYSQKELENKVESVCLFAKLTPIQKQQIVKTLQKNGHIVGFMGDGINDSLALNAADCSISVENAVDITKQCANIILLKKNLQVLANGVEEGRKTFGNIVKYIKMSACSNFGNVFSITGSAFLFTFLPMTAVQLLIQTLLYEFSQCAIPFDNVDEEYKERPRKWEIKDIAKFMVLLGPISSIFDFSTWGVMWFYFGNHGNTEIDVTQFQTAWFTEGLLAQTIVVHVIRTHKIPFLESRASGIMSSATILVVILGLSISYTGLAEYVPYVPPPKLFYIFLVVFLSLNTLLTQFAKKFYYKYNGLK